MITVNATVWSLFPRFHPGLLSPLSAALQVPILSNGREYPAPHYPSVWPIPPLAAALPSPYLHPPWHLLRKAALLTTTSILGPYVVSSLRLATPGQQPDLTQPPSPMVPAPRKGLMTTERGQREVGWGTFSNTRACVLTQFPLAFGNFQIERLGV